MVIQDRLQIKRHTLVLYQFSCLVVALGIVIFKRDDFQVGRMMKSLEAEHILRLRGGSFLPRMPFMSPLMSKSVLPPMAPASRGFGSLPGVIPGSVGPVVPGAPPGPWNIGTQGFDPFYP